MLCDEIVLLEDVNGRRLVKALLPRISVLFERIAGLPAVKIDSPAKREKNTARGLIIAQSLELHPLNPLIRRVFNHGRPLTSQPAI